MNQESEYIIYTDGGSRGNPGEAAYGYVVYDKSMMQIHEEGKYLGIQTNNYAEYMAVLEGLRWVEQNSNMHKNGNRITIRFFMDSMLCAQQLSGKWKIKNEVLRSLYFSIKEIEGKIKCDISFSHVYREHNKEADRLVNIALDNNR